ncbi:hypothetical protein ACIQU4_20060 [Streptomyces sp. NPDC090741]|uniref:hypothetical protein n=1 Tax=Streptomyces sp. NPDC090741 TaxID=3365967 RepID=UPI003825B143
MIALYAAQGPTGTGASARTTAVEAPVVSIGTGSSEQLASTVEQVVPSRIAAALYQAAAKIPGVVVVNGEKERPAGRRAA